MEPEVEIQKEMHFKLLELHKEIAELRGDGKSQAEIERHTANFEHEWQGRLVTEQQAELRGRKIEAREHVDRQDVDYRMQANVVDNRELKHMGPTAQIAYWDNAPSRSGINQEYELAKKTNSEFDRINDITSAKYATMSTVLTQSLIAIENGQEPDFLALLTKQIEQEQLQSAAKDKLHQTKQNGYDGENER